MLTQALYVAIGGAAGAVMRFGIMSLVGLTHFPYATLLVNILGSFLLGLLLEANSLYISLSEPVRLALVVGALGAFTTFSTFSMDTVYLLQKGDVLKAALYITASIILSIGAFYLGMMLLRSTH